MTKYRKPLEARHPAGPPKGQKPGPAYRYPGLDALNVALSDTWIVRARRASVKLLRALEATAEPGTNHSSYTS